MNQLLGKIVSSAKAQGISFVKVDVEGCIFGITSLGGEWREGERVGLYFKESDVMVAHKSAYRLSARNKFLSPVISLVQSGVLARIAFGFNGGVIYSLISLEACRELEIQENEEFIWFVKSNEIILESLER